MKNSPESGGSNAATPIQSNLRVSQQIAYALPTLGTFFLIGPIGLIQGIYAKYFGVALTTIAAVLLISRIFDAVTDPIIGYVSDRYYALTGSRKPFIVFGCLMLIVSSYFLWVPVNPSSVDASTKVSGLYFFLCFLAFYLSHTIFEIPHMAWGSELAVTTTDKNSIFAWRIAMASCGGLLFYIVPLLPFFETSDITPQTLQWTALAASIVMLPALFLSLYIVPSGQSERPKEKQRNSQRLDITMIIKNKPLLIFLSAFMLTGLSLGMVVALQFIFIDSYLKMGEHFALISLISIVASILSLRVWVFLAARLGKQIAWCMGVVMIVIGILVMSALNPEETNFQLLLIVSILGTCGGSAGSVIAPSVLSDVIDYSSWKFGVDCSASFFSLYTLAIKANVALGGALGFFIAGWYNFDPSAIDYSSDSIFGLRLAFIFIPAFIALASIFFIVLLPISARRHALIKRCLDNRTIRASQQEVSPQKPIRDTNQVNLKPVF